MLSPRDAPAVSSIGGEWRGCELVGWVTRCTEVLVEVDGG